MWNGSRIMVISSKRPTMSRNFLKSYSRVLVNIGRVTTTHHIVEQTWAERFGFARSEIDDPSNLVSIPRLTHYRITGWYGTRNIDFNYLSPREYLRNKSWEERRQIGLGALVMFGVLKP